VVFDDPELPLEARILLAARACGRNRNRRPGGDRGAELNQASVSATARA
jgi:hypothetical protein